MPDGLWEIAMPLLPLARMRPQGGKVANIAVSTAVDCSTGDQRLVAGAARLKVPYANDAVSSSADDV